MIHLRPRLHRRRWTVIERIGHVITQRCQCGKTRTRIRPNARPPERRTP